MAILIASADLGKWQHAASQLLVDKESSWLLSNLTQAEGYLKQLKIK